VNETTLAAAIINWLIVQHWDVYQEVKFYGHGGIADIAAVRDGKLWIIECKTSLTFTVLEQASAWRSHYRSIAVPAPKKYNGRQTAYHVAKNFLSVGVLEYRPITYEKVYEIHDAPIMREHNKFAKSMIEQLKDGHKTHAIAGSSNGMRRFTPYVETMERVKNFITKNPECSLKEIMDHLGENHHYANSISARGSIRTALESWESSWCEVLKDGKGNLTYRAITGFSTAGNGMSFREGEK